MSTTHAWRRRSLAPSAAPTTGSPFVPRRRKEKVLCRNCAASILDIHPPGAEAPPAQGPDLYEQLGVEKNVKRRVRDLKIDRQAAAGSVVYKRKRKRD